MLVEERRRKNQSTRRKPLEAKDPERTNHAPGTNELLVTRCRPTLGSRGYFLFFLGISRTISGARVLSPKLPPLNLVPRALFPGFGPAPKAREKRPGDEVGLLCPVKSPLVLT